MPVGWLWSLSLRIAAATATATATATAAPECPLDPMRMRVDSIMKLDQKSKVKSLLREIQREARRPNACGRLSLHETPMPRAALARFTRRSRRHP